MKKILTSTALVAALLTTVQADFNFGDVFADLEKAQNSTNKKAKETTIKAPKQDFIFADMFKDLKTAENAKESTVKLPNTDFVFGDVFRDLKVAENSKG